MPRNKQISDTEVLEAALTLFARDGDKGVSFGMVGKATGLAPATLVQRFVSREALYGATIAHGWTRAMAAFQRCEVAILPNGHNAVAFLKALGDELSAPSLAALLIASQSHELSARAGQFRQAVEASLQSRIEKGPGQVAEAAAAIFAAWQGRQLWQGTQGGDFRLRSILKKKQA